MFDVLFCALLDDKGRDDSFSKRYYSDECSSATILALAFAALASVWLNNWAACQVCMSSLWKNFSYRNLTFFMVISSARNMVLHLMFIPALRRVNGIDLSWVGVDIFSCSMLGVYETFFNILEIEALTHVCIERFVVARYNHKGWPINRNHYILFVCSSIFFASLYTYSINGSGGYWYQYDYNPDPLDMQLPDTTESLVQIVVFVLRTIKPVIIMIASLFWARRLEEKSGNEERIIFTKKVIVITIINVMCWLPLAVVEGYFIMEQVINRQVLLEVGKYLPYFEWALVLNMMAPGLTATVLIIGEEEICSKMRRNARNSVVVAPYLDQKRL